MVAGWTTFSIKWRNDIYKINSYITIRIDSKVTLVDVLEVSVIYQDTQKCIPSTFRVVQYQMFLSVVFQRWCAIMHIHSSQYLHDKGTSDGLSKYLSSLTLLYWCTGYFVRLMPGFCSLPFLKKNQYACVVRFLCCVPVYWS